MTTAALNFDLNNLPKSLREEVKDFVDFLKHKHSKTSKPKKREFGFCNGKVKISEDFDNPLIEFKDYM